MQRSTLQPQILSLEKQSKMREKKHAAMLRQGQFNTLAQTGTGKPAIIINGNGSKLQSDKELKGRAKRKMITQKMALSLIDVSNKTGNEERKKSYWNTYYCQNKIHTVDGKLHGKYCKNRFCTICCSIRKAVLINKYLPEVEAWENPFFVTLTAKAVSSKSLPKRMKDMNRGFRKISSRYRKRAQRRNGIKLVGLKSLECNFNPIKRTYNPHLHILVANEAMADILIEEWLKLCTAKFASPKAQHKRKVENKIKDLIEIIKYGSKIFTEVDLNNRLKSEATTSIFAAALDNIFVAMKGIRIFDRFGFNLSRKNRNTGSLFIAKEYREWIFDAERMDWFNTDSDERLSNYNPARELIQLLANNINTELA